MQKALLGLDSKQFISQKPPFKRFVGIQTIIREFTLFSLIILVILQSLGG